MDNCTQNTLKSTRISPLFNDAFIRIFGGPGAQRLTQSLVNAVLRAVSLDEIDEIISIDAEHTAVGGSVDCKTPRYDVRIVAENRLVDLEAERHEGNIDDRSLYYGVRLMNEGLDKGEQYTDLPQAIVITLLDAAPKFPDEQEYIGQCSMVWHHGDHERPGSQKMVFILVELAKFKARYTELTDEVRHDELLSWLYLMTKGYQDQGEVDSIVSAFPSIEEFSERYGIALDDPKIKRAYEDYQSSILEENRRQQYYDELKQQALEQGLAEGREKGLAEGLEEGREQGLAEGREEGLAEGREEGREKGREEVLAAVRDLGVDEAILQRALEMIEAKDK